MANRRPYDHEKHYGELKPLIDAASGRGSRTTEPILRQIEALIEQKVEERLPAKEKERPRPPEQALASYRIGQDMKDRVDKVSRNYKMKKGDFVKALLIYALDELETGSWDIS